MPLKEKIEKILSGELTNYKFTDDEFKSLIKALGDSDKAEKLRAQLGLDSTQNLIDSLPDILSSAANGENYFARLERKMKRGELAEDLSAGFNTLVDLAQLGVSVSQIGRSNRALKGLSRPSLPQVPREDESLSRAISEAQRGTFDTARALAPVRQGISDAYTSDLETARQVAGGQAATFGGLAQAANLRRMRGFNEMAPLIDTIRSREQSRLDNLLALRQGERQRAFQNKMDLYGARNQAYQADVAIASDLGMAGRENLFTSLGNLSDDLSVIGSRYLTQPVNVDFNRRIRNRTGVQELDSFEEQVNSNPYFNYGRVAPQPSTGQYYGYGRYTPN